MSIFDKLKSFEFDRNKNRNFGRKCGIIWGNSKEGNFMFPLLYISKPKHVSEEEYKELLDSIDIQFIKK